MYTALPRSRATAGPWGRRTCPPHCRGRAPPRALGRRTCPPHCRGRAPPRGLGADEHVRRAAEVARHCGVVGPTNMSAALPRSSVIAGPPRIASDDMSAALPRSRATAGPGRRGDRTRRTCPPRCRGRTSPRGRRDRGRRTCPPRCRGRAPPRAWGRRTCPPRCWWPSCGGRAAPTDMSELRPTLACSGRASGRRRACSPAQPRGGRAAWRTASSARSRTRRVDRWPDERRDGKAARDGAASSSRRNGSRWVVAASRWPAGGTGVARRRAG